MLRDLVRIGIVASASAAMVAAAPAWSAAQEEGGSEESCELQGTDITAQAEDLINEAVQADTTGQAEVARAKYRQAMARVRLALNQNEEDATAFWLGGRVHVGQGDYAAADSMLTRFLELEPACTRLVRDLRFQAWADAYNAGIRDYQAGDDSAALEDFEKANQIDEDPRSLNNAALLQSQRGNVERAKSLYQRSLEVAEDTAQYRAAAINLAELHRNQGDMEAALEAYRTYLSEQPEDARALVNFAVALRQVDMSDSAQAVLDRVLQRGDLEFDEWFSVGLTLTQMQSYEGARHAFRQARESRPFDRPTMQNLVQVNVGLGDFERASSLGDTLVSWFPYEKQLYRTLMQSLDQQGRTDEVQALLPRLQNMPLEVLQMGLVQRTEQQYVVQGQVGSGTAAGQTVTLPVELVGPDGETVARKEAEIQVPAQGEAIGVQIPFQTDGPVSGFRYGEVQGGS